MVKVKTKSKVSEYWTEYWQDRREFLDYPIQTHGYWKCLNKIAHERNIKTMRELLKKIPYHELRNDDILNGSQSRAFIYFLIYFRCFKMLDLSFPVKTKDRPLSAHFTSYKDSYPTTSVCCRIAYCKCIILQNLEDQSMNRLDLVN